MSNEDCFVPSKSFCRDIGKEKKEKKIEKLDEKYIKNKCFN